MSTEQIKNIEFNSIYMGDALRYVAKASINGQVSSKLLSINESKYFTLLNIKEKQEFARALFLKEVKELPTLDSSVFEEKTESLLEAVKLFQIEWEANNRKHTTVIKAGSDKIAVERIHAKGGNVLTVREIGGGQRNSGVYESINDGITRFKRFLNK